MQSSKCDMTYKSGFFRIPAQDIDNSKLKFFVKSALPVSIHIVKKMHIR